MKPKTVILAAENPDRSVIGRGLRAHNTSHIGPPRWKALAVLAREGRRIVGGLKGYTHWEWLYIAMLWIEEPERGKGLGTRLVRLAEREGRRRGCRHAWLDTYDFQAPGFYRKLGYRLFGRLPDYPVRGRIRFFFTRSLR